MHFYNNKFRTKMTSPIDMYYDLDVTTDKQNGLESDVFAFHSSFHQKQYDLTIGQQVSPKTLFTSVTINAFVPNNAALVTP